MDEPAAACKTMSFTSSTSSWLRSRLYDNDIVTYSFRIKFLQPEQTPRSMFDKVVTTDKFVVQGNHFQDKFNTRWQCNVCIFKLSHIFEFAQNLIGRLCNNYEHHRIM